MDSFNVIYLDDEKDALIFPIRDKLQNTKELIIEIIKPKAFENQIDDLIPLLDKCNALILDLQLNGVQEDGAQVRYQAPPLAQQLRILASEGKCKDVPLILCSTNEKIKVSFERDFTSHDLFDWTFLKSEISNETIAKIISIIRAYDFINKHFKDFSSFLNREYTEVDERVLSRFINEDKPPTHEIARTIFKDIIQETGILIDENILGARLGIDITESKESWQALLECFNVAKYNGIFSDGWNRWWSDKVNSTFSTICNNKVVALDGPSRVALLAKVLGIKNLVPAKPLKHNFSLKFWTICQATKKPLDPFEGFKIDLKKEPKPWQEYSYVSLYALLERQAERMKIQLHPSERERFSETLESLDS